MVLGKFTLVKERPTVLLLFLYTVVYLSQLDCCLRVSVDVCEEEDEEVCVIRCGCTCMLAWLVIVKHFLFLFLLVLVLLLRLRLLHALVDSSFGCGSPCFKRCGL